MNIINIMKMMVSNKKIITKKVHFIFSLILFYTILSLGFTLFYYNKVEKDPISFYSNSNKEWSDIREDISKSDFLETTESWRNITSEIKNLQDPFSKDNKDNYRKSFSDMLNKNTKETIDLIKSKEIKRKKEVDSISINDLSHLKINEKKVGLELYIEKIKLLGEKQKKIKYISSPLGIFIQIFSCSVICAFLILLLYGLEADVMYYNNTSLILLSLLTPAFYLVVTVF